MLHVFRNRLATCLLAVVYLTAGAAGNMLHSHAHGHHDHADAAGDVCRYGQSHDEHGEHEALALVTVDDGHDDDCTVCRAVGQRVVPIQNVQLVELRGRIEPLRIVVTHETIAVSARAQHSRAPPRAS